MFLGAALALLGNYYVYDAIAPVAELLSQQLHFSDTQIGTLNAIYSLPNIFLVAMGGVLVDRFGARNDGSDDRDLPARRHHHRVRRAFSGPWLSAGWCSASGPRRSWWRPWSRSRNGSPAATLRCCSPST
jgi:MFS family permease